MDVRKMLCYILVPLAMLILVAAAGGHLMQYKTDGGDKGESITPPEWEKVSFLAFTESGVEKMKVHLVWKSSRFHLPTSYNVYRSSTSGKGYRFIGSTEKNEFIDDAVRSGKTYYYVVTAEDATGKESKYSEERKVVLNRELAMVEGAGADTSENLSGESTLSPKPGLMHSFGSGGSLSLDETEESIVSPNARPGKKEKRRGSGLRAGYDTLGEPFDEVWVIQRADRILKQPDGEAMPGQGELRATVPGEEKEIPLPLRHTEVEAAVSGYMARVNVTQSYHNPYDAKIEAVYLFPLPQNAAVTDFIMTVGERRIRGIIREREEAKRIYLDARRQGYVASLLTQERPNIFTQRVANIEPGKEIDIEMVYFNTLAYSEGEYTFVFPMVIGPRYNPPGWKNGIGAVGRGSQSKSGQPVEVQYLKPGERSGHDIMVSVDVDAGVSIEKIYSNTHVIHIARKDETRAAVRLKETDTIPNKDFVLRFGVAGKKVKSAMMIEGKEDGGYFTLILQPPSDLRDLPRVPKEMVFVLDCSGSMSGWPIGKAKAAMVRALKNLSRKDTFQIIRFSNNASALGPAPLPATRQNIERGLRYVKSLSGSGGTQMIEGIKAALDFPHDEGHLRIVSFMTDGYIGNESQILHAIDEKLGDSRIFSFGVGSSVNRYLIERMAKVGRGAVAYITTGDSDVEAVDRFYRRIGHPGLTDISVDWGSMDVYDVFPKKIPDLFVGRPVIITGRFRGDPGTGVTIRGRAGNLDKKISLTLGGEDQKRRHEGISRIWARAKIADLMDRMIVTGDEGLKKEVLETALTHKLVSAYTSFVAVDESRRTEGDSGTTVFVPVPVPQGVKYETTVTR